MEIKQNSKKMKLNQSNRPRKVEVWKNQFWQRNGQKTMLLLIDSPVKVDPFLSCFLLWF